MVEIIFIVILELQNANNYTFIETLWRIIYSDNRSDMYEANLMRRLTGLLYLDPKEVGDIKEKIIKELNR